MHNRRKRAAFYAEQHAIYGRRLLEAIETEKSGRPLDDDQTLVINRERARVRAEEVARERTWRKRIKGVFLGNLKNDEEAGTGEKEEEIVVLSEWEVLQKLGVDQKSILEQATQPAGKESEYKTVELDDNGGREESTGEGGSILQAVAEERREGERVVEAAGVRGGPLDRMAEGAVKAVAERAHAAEEKIGGGSGWTNWWTGK